jgi:hypothetical protein
LVGDEPAFKIEAKATLSKHPQAEFHMAEFDLGTLPAGKSGQVTLLIKNPFDRAFKFSEITKTCNCLDLKSDSYQIDADSTQKFTMTLQTPETAENARVFSSVALLEKSADKPRAVINLKMDYSLSGVLSIDPNMVLVEIPKGTDFQSLRVPVLLTQPLLPSELKIEASDTLRDLEFKIAEESGSVFVIADVHAAAIESGPISGEVRVTHEKSKRKDGFFVTARIGSAIRVSPSILRFKKTDDDSNRWTANALIRLPKRPKGSETNETTAEDDVAALKTKAIVNGKNAKVDVKQLATRIFRVTVSLESFVEDEDQKVQWQIDDGKETERIDSKFIVVD